MPQGKKTASRTYGSKDQPRKLESTLTAAASDSLSHTALRTPFLRKLLRPHLSASPLAQPALRSHSCGQICHKKSRQLPIKSTSDLREAQRSLVGALCSFLNSTKPANPPSRKGVRSFHQMCLRKVPQYIEAEEAWLREIQDDTDADAVDQTYTFLESLGHGETSGFAGLREVVRSHGLHMITKAIEDGFLRDGFVKELVETCAKCEAVSEGQAILHAWSYRSGRTDEGMSSRKLRMLLGMSFPLESTESLFQCLAHLLAEGDVLPSQINRLESIWRPLLHALAVPESRLDAMHFLEAYMVARENNPSGRQDQVADRHSFARSTVVMLAAMVCMQERDASLSTNNEIVWQLQRLVYSFYTHPGESSGLVNARPFILAALLSSGPDSCNNTIMTTVTAETLLNTLAPKDRPRSSSGDVDFLLEVGKVISHIEPELAIEIMREKVLELARISSKQSAMRSIKYLRSLAIDSAMAWAESQDDPASYDWAENVEGLFETDDAALQAMQTPISQRPTKYRWEAGMCEWIQATPFNGIKQRSARDSDVARTLDDSGICMPTSESPKRKRSRSLSESEEDSDLEDRDELSMQTPELIRLRDQRARKVLRELSPASEKENLRPAKQQKRAIRQSRGSAASGDMSEDELGL